MTPRHRLGGGSFGVLWLPIGWVVREAGEHVGEVSSSASSPASMSARPSGSMIAFVAHAANADKPNQVAQDATRPDGTNCRSALANKVRLVVHTAAYWLTLTIATAFSRLENWPPPRFATLPLRPLKIAIRVVENLDRGEGRKGRPWN
jgi:hypothetical protein